MQPHGNETAIEQRLFRENENFSQAQKITKEDNINEPEDIHHKNVLFHRFQDEGLRIDDSLGCGVGLSQMVEEASE